MRVNEGADRHKGFDAEKASVNGLEVWRQRMTAPQEALRMDDLGNGTLYIGVAEVGSSELDPVWKIKKVLTIGMNTSILWAEDADYSQIWAMRASLNYR